MDTDLGTASAPGLKEDARQMALLHWATARLELLSNRSQASDGIAELLDCLAYFTREHFGFHERLLKEYSAQRTYLMERMAVHGEFRRRLAAIYMDAMRGDPTVTDRLNALCQELWLDIRTQQETLDEIARKAAKEPRLRLRKRRDATPFYAALHFDS